MKNMLSLIGSILGWTTIVVVFACIGFFTDNPGFMVPLYGIITIIVLTAFLFMAKRQKNRTYEQLTTPVWLPICYCIVLTALSITFPSLAISFFRPGEFHSAIIYLVTVLAITVGFGGVWMINVMGLKNKIFSIVGFLILVLLALIPALLIAPFDPSYGTLGVIYFTMALEAIIVWTAINFIHKNIILNLDMYKSLLNKLLQKVYVAKAEN